MDKILSSLAIGAVVGSLAAWAALSQADRSLDKKKAEMQSYETVWALDAADTILCEEQLGIKRGVK
jgi:hypothetical protein